MESKRYTQCGGCGAETPLERCIGCFHPFEPFFKNEYVEWVNLADKYTEDWQTMHCRYALDGRKLDTDLFEEKDNSLIKVGGTGRLEYKEVEYMVTSPTIPSSNELVQENEQLRRWKAEALTLLSLVDAYADKHPEIKLGQGKVEFTIVRAKERDELKERCDKIVMEHADLNLALAAMLNGYQNLSPFQRDAFTVPKDLIDAYTKMVLEYDTPDAVALKEGESNTPAPAKEIEYMPILSAELYELRAFSNVPVRVPLHLLDKDQAMANHGQTLQRLKERGGLSIKEALSLMTLKRWMHYKDMPMVKAIAMLNDLIANNNPH